MIKALYASSSGMAAQSLTVDIIANNLANVNTTGFKKDRVDFQDLLYQVFRPAGTSSSEGTEVPTGIQVGSGTRPVAVQKIFSEGDLLKTDNSLDLAIEGDGFFQILQPDGTIGYSRDGAFKIDSTGRIVNSDGFPMDPEITIPADTLELSVGTDGTVEALVAGSEVPTNLGQITLAKFTNPAGLKAEGRNLFLETNASGNATTGTAGLTGFGTIAQGYLENSNVRVIDEMVNLIVAQRAYEVNSKAIQSSDEMLKIANSLKR